MSELGFRGQVGARGRFGEYSTHELGIQPEAYDPRLDVDFTVLRGDAPTSESYSPAA
ncbi:hypothetical protein JL475_37320 [Streptomyces sp. M2CJ-2]|uniref:hypothetical protein n=1 Tax=Streptomyces sp. M2CJ-2 TaxID=2803948 RepID=UPI0019264F34|nr:hypothetical protein [Streptomyces sp. M2CJ-2]MBL3671455.1 hypothetical protein [Streptomyces sp. M2CJ-2]